MKLYQYLILGTVTIGVLSSFFGCRDPKKSVTESAPESAPEAPSVETPAEYQQADIYRSLRNQILALEPEMLGLATDYHEPLAVLMETGYSEDVVTLVCVADGSASLYFSNGGGIIGAGEHQAVRDAARSFIASFGPFQNAFEPTTDYPLPDVGLVRFYIVTSTGVVAAQQTKEDDLGNMRDQLSPLFHQGHDVIAAIRENTPE